MGNCRQHISEVFPHRRQAAIGDYNDVSTPRIQGELPSRNLASRYHVTKKKDLHQYSDKSLPDHAPLGQMDGEWLGRDHTNFTP